MKKRFLLLWHDPLVRGICYQALLLGLIALGIWYLLSNTLHNLAVRNIHTGFDFLGQEAGFAIGESVISYSPADTYARAIVVGVLNTLKVSLLGVVFATMLGTLIGIARLSTNWLLARLAGIYIEVMRNIPLLLHLFFWYALITETMPRPRQALNPLPGVFLSNRGLMLPSFSTQGLYSLAMYLAAGMVFLILYAYWAKYRKKRLGRAPDFFRVTLIVIILCLTLALGLSSVPVLEFPALKGFNFIHGTSLSPEFTALILGLISYTAAFIAEVVRSGIQAVDKGQWEAAASIGLPYSLILRKVVLPQALRIIVPPMTSQYLNLMKNSSLAVAIGYPDIVSVVNTTLNQTGQAIEGVAIIMLAYLSVSLTISVFMNMYNKKIALTQA